jgi:hypothetical protein
MAGAIALAIASLTATPTLAQVATPLLDQLISPNAAGGGIAYQPGVTVTSRARPEYVSSGVRLGNVVVRPQLAESTGYESNVLATSKARGSAIIETNASLDASSDWSNNGVRAALSVDDVRYPSLSLQSYTNWTASLGGVYEIGRDVLSVAYSHLALTQTPGSLGTPQLQQPLPFTVDLGSVSYRVNFSRLYVTPSVLVASYKYSNGTLGGVTFQQDFQDRLVVSPSVTVGYELSPRRNLVMVVRDSNANYTNEVAGIGSLNYNDIAVLGGFDYDADAVIRYRALVGYEERSFQNAQFKTIQAPIFEASAIWTPTGLTTVTGAVGRLIQASSTTSSTTYTETYGQLRVDHEYLPNVLLRADLGAYSADYSAGGGTQVYYTAGVGVTYLLNRNMQLAASYNFIGSQSNASGTNPVFGQSYTDNRVFLTLRVGL